MPYLIQTNGSYVGRRIELDKASMVMGRHPECDIVLDVAAVSRQHARVFLRDERYHIEDLKSRNGTLLNSKLVTMPIELQEGDTLRICEVDFGFHLDVEPMELGRAPHLDGADGSSFGIELVDDANEGAGQNITSKVNMRESSYGTQFTSSAEIRLAALLEITHNLGKAVSLEEILPKVLDTLFTIFLQADRGFIVLLDPQGNPIPRWVKTRRPDQEETVRVSRTVIRQVIEQKEAIISFDASSDERFDMSQSIADFRIRSMIVAPLLDADGVPVGAIQMDTLDQRQRFEKKDLEILVAVAVQAGIAIRNAQLNEQIRQKQAVEQDLKLARQVQQAFLPNKPLELPGYRFFHYYKPAEQVGGDYFDYIALNDGRVAIIVADVSGHGVPAAMFMAKVSAEARFALGSNPDPALAIAQLNDRICDLGVDKFVTVILLVLNLLDGEVTIANAGHMAPLWRTQEGEILEPSEDVSGLGVGMYPDQDYESTKVILKPGELMVLYTDGINEAPDPNGQQFTTRRLCEIIKDQYRSVDELGKSIIHQVTQHVADGPPEDDMCLVIFGRSNEAARTISFGTQSVSQSVSQSFSR